MHVEHTLNLRKDISRLGIAPCTTMYWFSETAKADRDRLAARSA